MLSPRMVFEGLLELIAPSRCAACDEVLTGDERGFCGGCGILIDDAPKGVLPPARGASLHVFAGPLADAIRRMKYDGRIDHLPALADLMAVAAGAYGGLVDAIVPVPLHRRRLAERGFNQAALLARPLARSLGVPLRVGCLVRVRPTRPQVGLEADARRDNVRGAFALRRGVPGRVLLVDDVRTTGATLAEAARVLVASGETEVRTLTLARAPAG